jgi:hypothetical protein
MRMINSAGNANTLCVCRRGGKDVRGGNGQDGGFHDWSKDFWHQSTATTFQLKNRGQSRESSNLLHYFCAVGRDKSVNRMSLHVSKKHSIAQIVPIFVADVSAFRDAGSTLDPDDSTYRRVD